MPKRIILTSSEKQNYEKYFSKGLGIAGGILLALKDGGVSFLEGMPDYYGFGPYKKFFGVGKYRKKDINKKTLQTNLYRLQKQGLITKDPKQKVFVLTPEGRRILMEIDNRMLIFEKPWDGKLRLVFFDIPEAKKRWREWLRKELNLMEFRKVQESVYVGKYPLPQSFYKEISHQELDEYVFIITAGEIDKQEKILKVFDV